MIILQASQNDLYMNKKLLYSHESESSKKLCKTKIVRLTICFWKTEIQKAFYLIQASKNQSEQNSIPFTQSVKPNPKAVPTINNNNNNNNNYYYYYYSASGVLAQRLKGFVSFLSTRVQIPPCTSVTPRCFTCSLDLQDVQ